MTLSPDVYEKAIASLLDQNVKIAKQLREVYETPIGAAVKELADLRAYKERTEAGLRELCSVKDAEHGAKPLLASLGLWRDPKPTSEETEP